MKSKLPAGLNVWGDTEYWQYDEWSEWCKDNPNVNLNIEDSEGKTLLDYFLSRGQRVLDLLIKNGMDVNFKYSSGKSKLHYLAEKSDPIRLNSLLKQKNLIVDIPDDKGYTPLYYAKNLRTATTLTGKGAKLLFIKDKIVIPLPDPSKIVIPFPDPFKIVIPLPDPSKKIEKIINTKIALSITSEEEDGVTGIALDKKLSSIKFTSTNVLDYRDIVDEKINTKKIDDEQLNDIFKKAKIKATEFLENCDGLAIGGNSAAVAPEFFNGTIELGGTNKARSIAELALIHVAVNKGIPIIGCCGGHQIVNVYFGSGIKKKNADNIDIILIDPESRLAKIIMKNPQRKNKNLNDIDMGFAHSDVVDNMKKDSVMEVAAYINTESDLTEKVKDIAATESKYGAPIATYQFHPEFGKIDQDIIEAFVKNCQTYKLKKEVNVDKSLNDNQIKSINVDALSKNLSETNVERNNPLYDIRRLFEHSNITKDRPITAAAMQKPHETKFPTAAAMQKPHETKFPMEVKHGLSNFREILNNTSTKTQTQKILDKNKVDSKISR